MEPGPAQAEIVYFLLYKLAQFPSARSLLSSYLSAAYITKFNLAIWPKFDLNFLDGQS